MQPPYSREVSLITLWWRGSGELGVEMSLVQVPAFKTSLCLDLTILTPPYSGLLWVLVSQVFKSKQRFIVTPNLWSHPHHLKPLVSTQQCRMECAWPALPHPTGYLLGSLGRGTQDGLESYRSHCCALLVYSLYLPSLFKSLHMYIYYQVIHWYYNLHHRGS